MNNYAHRISFFFVFWGKINDKEARNFGLPSARVSVFLLDFQTQGFVRDPMTQNESCRSENNVNLKAHSSPN